MMSGIVNDGVIGTGFAVTAGAGMQVAVALGKAWVSGIIYEETTGPVNLTIAAADLTNPRIDLVVAHEDITGQGSGSQLKVITGTPAPSPVAPTPTQTAYATWEIPLATVLVPANAASSASFTITDKRTYAANLLQPSGVPETGFFSNSYVIGTSGISVGPGVNYKRVMRQAPSSITVTAINQSNAGAGAAVTNIDVYGFSTFWTPGNTGQSYFTGHYTTVGNCLKGIHATGMFDIHCDGCDRLLRGRSLRHDLLVIPVRASRPSLVKRMLRRKQALLVEGNPYALAHACPECGNVENFNNAMTSEDEALQIPGWERRMEQAYLIRQAMEQLRLPRAA